MLIKISSAASECDEELVLGPTMMFVVLRRRKDGESHSGRLSESWCSRYMYMGDIAGWEVVEGMEYGGIG